ncbi:spore coat protein [Candidatus Parcubacteria bacterium 4484_255]|nr:MAG: spore coat protein [Candidatus Parcubacteria bacterium 4484_255]
MKGVILAAGKGTRLLPCTKVTNKTLLPVYNKPMICYPLETLRSAGIKEVMTVVNKRDASAFKRLLGNGKEWGLKHIEYIVQKNRLGSADALRITEKFANKEKIILIFGDNIIEESIKKDVEIFKKQTSGARFFLKKVEDPCRFGIAEIKDNKIIDIEEKPKNPKSNLAIAGIYMYDKQVFDIIRTIKPSARGEYEITDINNFYVKNDIVTYRILNKFLSDAGTFKSLHQAACFMANKQNKTI